MAKRYLTGLMAGGSIGFVLEGDEDELFARICRLITSSRRHDTVWQISEEDPFYKEGR